MSTVPEIIVARHCKIRILALSLVTNKAVLEPGPNGDDRAVQDCDREALNKTLAQGKASHQEVLDAGIEAAEDVQVSRADMVGGYTNNSSATAIDRSDSEGCSKLRRLVVSPSCQQWLLFHLRIGTGKQPWEGFYDAEA